MRAVEPCRPDGGFTEPALADPSAPEHSCPEHSCPGHFCPEHSCPEHFCPRLAHPASKAAVNMLTVQCATAFGGIRINAADPGFTATGLDRDTGTRTVEQGAEVIVRLALLDAVGPTGTFQNAAGVLPWWDGAPTGAGGGRPRCPVAVVA
ncbi:hypothetical protein ACGFYV_04165 [Streptomyces sp. NPDC048297]|uniref:hypothetical protein n=1 Tax=Streptomyces sp. NPDC048297 TaxID=3365531 RepID=UPI0037129354